MTELDNIKMNVPILEMAKRMGLTPIKIGKYYTLKEHDSVRIDVDKNLFIRNSTGERGSVIDFVMAFAGIGAREAIRALKDEININSVHLIQKEQKKDQVEFRLPEKDDNLKNVFAYLIKTRGIDSDIVKEFVGEKLLYQDKYKNCVFVSYKDDKPVFANKRGTNTYKKFIGDVAGSDYNHCFFIDNNSNKLIITESVIDAMSVMSVIKMAKKEIDYKEFNYLALSGVSKFETALKNHLNNKNYDSVILCLDNDRAGIEATEDIKNYIKLQLKKEDINVFMALPPEGDYNDYLKTLMTSSKMIKESVNEYFKNSSPLKITLQKIDEKEHNILHEKIRENFPFMTFKDVNATAGLIRNKFNDFIDLERLWKETKEGRLYYEKNNWEIAAGGSDLLYEITYKGEQGISIFQDGNVEIDSGFIYVEDKKTIIDILNENPLNFNEFVEKKIADEKILMSDNDIEI